MFAKIVNDFSTTAWDTHQNELDVLEAVSKSPRVPTCPSILSRRFVFVREESASFLLWSSNKLTSRRVLNLATCMDGVALINSPNGLIESDSLFVSEQLLFFSLVHRITLLPTVLRLYMRVICLALQQYYW